MKEKKSSYFTATWKMLAAVIIGGIAGGVSVVIYELMKKGIDAGIRTINGTIQQYIFPCLLYTSLALAMLDASSVPCTPTVSSNSSSNDSSFSSATPLRVRSFLTSVLDLSLIHI